MTEEHPVVHLSRKTAMNPDQINQVGVVVEKVSHVLAPLFYTAYAVLLALSPLIDLI